MAEDTNSSPYREVLVGDEPVRITRFRGLKAVLAGALMARVMRELPEIQEELTKWAKQYRENNFVEITPAMAKLPRFAPLGLSPQDFETADGPIRLPDEPTAQQIVIAMIPNLFDLARKEVQRFIALISIPNAELERADDEDQVESALDTLGKQLFRRGDIDQLLEVVVVGWDLMEDQIISKKDKLGKLQNLPFLKMLLSTQEDSDMDLMEEEVEEQVPEEETLKTSPQDVPASYIPSEDPIDGTEEQLSMESPGTRS